MENKRTVFLVGSVVGAAAVAALAAWSVRKAVVSKHNKKEWKAVDDSLNYDLVQSMEGSDAVAKY